MRNSKILNLKNEIFYTIFDTFKFNCNYNLNIYIIYASFLFHEDIGTLTYNIDNS